MDFGGDGGDGQRGTDGGMTGEWTEESLGLFGCDRRGGEAKTDSEGFGLDVG